MTECPSCGSDTYPILGRCVTCTNPECERYNDGEHPTCPVCNGE